MVTHCSCQVWWMLIPWFCKSKRSAWVCKTWAVSFLADRRNNNDWQGIARTHIYPVQGNSNQFHWLSLCNIFQVFTFSPKLSKFEKRINKLHVCIRCEYHWISIYDTSCSHLPRLFRAVLLVSASFFRDRRSKWKAWGRLGRFREDSRGTSAGHETDGFEKHGDPWCSLMENHNF